MSTFDTPPDDLDSTDSFKRALTDLVGTAIANDIDVRGGWSVGGDGRSVVYGIEIYRVERDGD